LREVAQGISVSTGEAFFESLVQHLAKALDADYAMVCESVPGGRLKSLACYSEHTLAATCDVSIGGSPMERVMNEVGVFAYRAGVAKEFPDCHFLEEWGIQSFIGIALIGSAGTRLGVIALMYRYPQRDISLEQEILPVFAVRAAVELERRMSEKELRENEALLRVIFDGAFQLMGLLTPEGTLIKINRTAYEFIEGKEETVLGKPFWETPWWNHSPAQQLTLRQAIAAAANGEFIRFAATHIRPDGGVIHVDFSLTPVKDEEGRVILLVPEGRIINRGD
jgi:PAS domain S-box-containing protein